MALLASLPKLIISNIFLSSIFLVPSWFTHVKGWLGGAETKEHGKEVKKATNEAVGRTGVLATGTTNTGANAYEGERDGKRIRWSTFENFTLDENDRRTSSTSRGNDGADDEDADESEETQRAANSKGWMNGSMKDSTNESASVHFADHLRGDSGHLPSRSTLLEDFKDRYGSSVRDAVLAIPKNANDVRFPHTLTMT